MTAWLTTQAAADMLGTTCTTIRSLCDRGELACQRTPVLERTRWRVSRDSVDVWLRTNGRIDERRLAKQLQRKATETGLAQDLVTLIRENQQLKAERDRLGSEVATLRAVAIQLRARNDAVTDAAIHQAEAVQHLLSAAQAYARSEDALRRGLTAQDDAIGQFLVPGPPTELGELITAARLYEPQQLLRSSAS
jgi:excisionase family DNA binding protein